MDGPAAGPAANTAAGWVYRSDATGSTEPAAVDSAQAVGSPYVVTPSDAPAPATPSPLLQDERAFAIVKKYSFYAAGAGVIPVPIIDLAAIAAIELKMVGELATVYDVPFSRDRVRPIVASLIGAYTATRLGYGAGAALLKTIPLFGHVLGTLAVPGFAAGLTWAVGRVFIQHFASGGTFLNLDPDQVRTYFAKKAPVV